MPELPTVIPDIEPIENTEGGLSVRNKLNAMIERTNGLDAQYMRRSPAEGNWRVKGGNEFQLRETAPTPGWRTVWLEDGALQCGPLDADPPASS